MRWITADPGNLPKDGDYVYVVCDKIQTYYVGQTCSLTKRVAAHRWVITPGGIIIRKLFIPGAILKYRQSKIFGEHLMAEWRLIDRLKPVMNKRKPYGGCIKPVSAYNIHTNDLRRIKAILQKYEGGRDAVV